MIVCCFQTKMQAALERISQSLDDAEGGLDGVIQALDCDVIVFFFHFSASFIAEPNSA